MEITVKQTKQACINGSIIANFSMIKTGENSYNIDNGSQIKTIILENSKFSHFYKKASEQGNFIFKGNKKQLIAFKEHADNLADKLKECWELNGRNLN